MANVLSCLILRGFWWLLILRGLLKYILNGQWLVFLNVKILCFLAFGVVKFKMGKSNPKTIIRCRDFLDISLSDAKVDAKTTIKEEF